MYQYLFIVRRIIMKAKAYNLLTLDGNYMIKDGFNEEKQIENIGTSKKPKWKAVYRYDISNHANADLEIIKSEEKHYENCAFFHQLALLTKEEKKKIEDENSLRESLLIVDFKDLFIRKINAVAEYENNYNSLNKGDDLKVKEGIKISNAVFGYRLRWMFDSENGIQLSFDGKKPEDPDKEWITFVPFDKSSSMAKECRITFIDKKLKEKLEKRLLLDIFYPDNISEIVPSKYYAYRGLYLSSGNRIEQDDNNFKLNEETVIVIKDRPELIFNLDYDSKNKKHFTDRIITAARNTDVDNKWECYEKDINDFAQNGNNAKKDDKITSFDGEGLICPDYVDYINEKLKNKSQNKYRKARSFQIRMPFIKGMLHEVDFHRFFKEQLPAAGIQETDKLLIEDVFGIRRDLRKAKIILTESMFKCTNWFKYLKLEHLDDNIKNELNCKYRYLGSSNADKKPEYNYMKFYFEKLKEYDHALYVSLRDSQLTSHVWVMPETGEDENNDPNMQSEPKYFTVPLNYQFLSTLKLEPEDLNELIADHKKCVDAVPQSITHNINVDLQDDSEDETDSSVKDVIETGWFAEREKCLKAWKMNDAFLTHSRFSNKIRKVIEEEKKLYTRNLLLGRLETEGEQRFLSGDLLGLLTYICQNIINPANSKEMALSKEIGEKMWKKCLHPHRFYMAEKKIRNIEEHSTKYNGIKLRYKKDYGILRNPHLSRNEQCILRPYIPYGEKSLYDDYFSKLKGIIMVSCRSSVPMALGGADFDGDLVKIISNKRVVDTIRNGVYDSSNGYPYERKLPVIQIPAPDSIKGFEANDKELFKNIINTFANEIGHISNIAVILTEREARGRQLALNLSPAACTIITGLEIDAAKTGEHPTGNIQELADETENEKNNFIPVKGEIAKIPGYYSLSSLNEILTKSTKLLVERIKGLVKIIGALTKEKTKGNSSTVSLELAEDFCYYTSEIRDCIEVVECSLKEKALHFSSLFHIGTLLMNIEYSLESKSVIDNTAFNNIESLLKDIKSLMKKIVPPYTVLLTGFHDIPLPNLDLLLIHAFSYIQEIISHNSDKQKEQADKEQSNQLQLKCFKFENDANWNELDENVKDKLEELIQAYLAVKSLAWGVMELDDASKKKSAFYLARFKTLLNIQYDSFYKELVDGVSISAALEQTSAFIAGTLKERSKNYTNGNTTETAKALFKRMLDKAIDKMAEIEWQYTGWDKELWDNKLDEMSDVREEAVAEILLNGIKSYTNENEFIEAKNNLIFDDANKDKFKVAKKLLTNFNNNGFMIFYFLLRDLQDRILNRDMDIDTYFTLHYEDDKEDDKNKNNKYKRIRNSKAFKDLRDIYSKYRPTKKSGWKQEAIKYVRECMFPPNNRNEKTLFSDENIALQYVCAIKNKRTMEVLWEIFTETEIQRNVVYEHIAELSNADSSLRYKIEDIQEAVSTLKNSNV